MMGLTGTKWEILKILIIEARDKNHKNGNPLATLTWGAYQNVLDAMEQLENREAECAAQDTQDEVVK